MTLRSFLDQTVALTWKNWLIKKHHWKSTVMEFGIPMIYFFCNCSATGVLF